MTNLEKIREACIKANPEIVELKFGCQVRVLGDVEIVFTEAKSNGDVEVYEMDAGRIVHYNIHRDKVLVLGRPIRLADVLLAMQAQAEKDLAHRRIPLPRSALFGKVANEWNLREDDLSKQSEETLTFLAQLLS